MSQEVDGKKFGHRYLESFKQSVVKEVEQECNISLVCERHGINRDTLRPWMKQYGSISYHKVKNKRFNLLERENIAREVVSGYLSIEESMLKYENNRINITKWVREYKRDQNNLLDLLPQAIVLAETESLSGSVPSADLKLAELKIRALEVMLDIASKEFKVDIRKKFGAKQ